MAQRRMVETNKVSDKRCWIVICNTVPLFNDVLSTTFYKALNSKLNSEECETNDRGIF
jgi:hypothetical protein